MNFLISLIQICFFHDLFIINMFTTCTYCSCQSSSFRINFSAETCINRRIRDLYKQKDFVVNKNKWMSCVQIKAQFLYNKRRVYYHFYVLSTLSLLSSPSKNRGYIVLLMLFGQSVDHMFLHIILKTIYHSLYISYELVTSKSSLMILGSLHQRSRSQWPWMFKVVSTNYFENHLSQVFIFHFRWTLLILGSLGQCQNGLYSFSWKLLCFHISQDDWSWLADDPIDFGVTRSRSQWPWMPKWFPLIFLKTINSLSFHISQVDWSWLTSRWPLLLLGAVGQRSSSQCPWMLKFFLLIFLKTINHSQQCESRVRNGGISVVQHLFSFWFVYFTLEIALNWINCSVQLIWCILNRL